MSQLGNYFEQIALSAAAIADLPFAQPKIFTNALLLPHDITTLIRDTEYHERALFQVPADPPPPVAQDPSAKPSDRRKTVIFGVNGGQASIDQFGAPGQAAAPVRPVNRRSTAVATLLGGDFAAVLAQTDRQTRGRADREGEVDVELLLQGAERLCNIYPIPNAREKIAALRSRYQKLSSSVSHYENKVERQGVQLNKLARREEGTEAEEVVDETASDSDEGPSEITEEDIAAEEAEIRELEQRKKELEERVSGMEKDLGGLLR